MHQCVINKAKSVHQCVINKASNVHQCVINKPRTKVSTRANLFCSLLVMIELKWPHPEVILEARSCFFSIHID